MPDQIKILADGRLLEIHVTGKLTQEFYEQFAPAIEEQIAECGALDVLLVMHDFHGWTAGAMWEDFKFDLKHGKDIERLAIVGESKWQKGMATFCQPFTKAKIQYFDHSQFEAAREWARGE